MLLQATHLPACGVRSWHGLPASSATGWVKCGSHSGLGLRQPVTGGCGPSAHRLTLLESVAPKALPGVHVLCQPTHWTGASALPEAARRRCRVPTWFCTGAAYLFSGTVALAQEEMTQGLGVGTLLVLGRVASGDSLLP